MQRLHYTKAVRPAALLEQLQAAIPALLPVVGPDGEKQAVMTLETTPTDVWVTVPDAVASAAVNAVVAAHDPAVLGVGEQQSNGDLADLAAFPTRAQVMNALAAIETDLTTLSGAVTLAQAGPILRRTVVNQRAIIRALAALVRRTAG